MVVCYECVGECLDFAFGGAGAGFLDFFDVDVRVGVVFECELLEFVQ